MPVDLSVEYRRLVNELAEMQMNNLKLSKENEQLRDLLQTCWASLRTYGRHPLIDENVNRLLLLTKKDEREIVGYRLNGVVSRKAVDGLLNHAMPIWDREDKSIYFLRGHVAGGLVLQLKEMGTLDLWFDPIYA